MEGKGHCAQVQPELWAHTSVRTELSWAWHTLSPRGGPQQLDAATKAGGRALIPLQGSHPTHSNTSPPEALPHAHSQEYSVPNWFRNPLLTHLPCQIVEPLKSRLLSGLGTVGSRGQDQATCHTHSTLPLVRMPCYDPRYKFPYVKNQAVKEEPKHPV